jgi:2-amino-4-hydroxy-6-hydroxymethyldihydropteridine diphosphokinase
MQRWTPAYVAVGSNLGEPLGQVRAALEALGRMGGSRLIARSPLFRSAPMGPQDQPWYVNAVAGLLTRRDPHQLLDDLQALERASGRKRDGERWGPRVLDLDLLLFGQRIIADERLIIPHPGLTERNFVVYPLVLLAPDLSLPDGRRLAVVAERLGQDGLEEITTPDRTPDDAP